MGGPHSHFRYGRPVRRQLDGQKEAIYPSGGETKGVLHRVKYPFCLDWLPGQDSNLRPAGYKYPDFSTGLGLSLHPPALHAGEGVGR
jgi:hypothetical protein